MVDINYRLQKVYKYCFFSSMTTVDVLTWDGEVKQETLLNFKLSDRTLAMILAKNQKILNFLVDMVPYLETEQMFADCGMPNSLWTTSNKQTEQQYRRKTERYFSKINFAHYPDYSKRRNNFWNSFIFNKLRRVMQSTRWQNPIPNVLVFSWSKMRHYCIGLICRYLANLSIPCCFSHVLPSITVVLVGRNHASFWW